MSTDRRALILRWIEEQEALAAKASAGPWWPGPYYKSDIHSERGRIGETGIMRGVQGWEDAAFIAASRSALPLALAALRREVEAHHIDGSGAQPICAECQQCCGDYVWPCAFIDRLFCSLGLQDSGR